MLPVRLHDHNIAIAVHGKKATSDGILNCAGSQFSRVLFDWEVKVRLETPQRLLCGVCALDDHYPGLRAQLSKRASDGGFLVGNWLGSLKWELSYP